jgi:peroxiredoxin Q/BCP
MKYKTIILTLFFALSQLLLADSLDVGDKAPLFSAKNQEGDIWSSKDHIGKKYLVVYFYPAAMTGGCTKQACSYRDDEQELENMDTEIIGISGDEVENLKIFEKENNLNFTLLADPEGKIAKKFGVPTRKGGKITRTVDGKEIELERGITTARWTFIIDKNGRIAYIDKNVKAAQDSKNIQKILKELQS